ncbi:MAG: PilN domain-containing protein, partial [Candidatus Tectomicrobia bacterium]|nr:PilN domain-containing protein [Candidatus Tectomicrobia bacterium]
LEKSLQEAQGELKSFEDKILRIREFRKSKARWSEVMRNVANATPGGIVLTALEDKSKGKLVLRGEASTSGRGGGPEQVAGFVERLGAQGSGLSAARLVSAQRVKTGEVEVIQFEVECAL